MSKIITYKNLYWVFYVILLMFCDDTNLIKKKNYNCLFVKLMI